MPNLFLDSAGAENRILGIKKDYPAQGLKNGENDFNLKVLEGPFQGYEGTLNAKPGVRYFIHSITLSARNAPENDCSAVAAMAYVKGSYRTLAYLMLVPNVANAASCHYIVDVLTDPNKAVVKSTIGTGALAVMQLTAKEVLDYDS